MLSSSQLYDGRGAAHAAWKRDHGDRHQNGEASPRAPQIVTNTKNCEEIANL
jgi:hypothetical protein